MAPSRRGLLRAAALPLAAPWAALGQAFPSRPIRVVSPHQAGGAIDGYVRALASELGGLLGQPLVIDPKPGAAGTIGAREVAASRADGYTLLANATIHVMYPGMFASLPFDPIADFVPVGLLGSSPLVVVVGSQSAYTRLEQLVGQARLQPGAISVASPGRGSLQHLVVELLNQRAGVRFNHVAYNGSASALADTAGGHVDAMISPAPAAEPMVRGGRLRVLAVTSAARLPSMPEVPTIAESGLAGLDATGWYGLWAPRGTPADVVARLNRAMREASAMPAVQQRMRAQGMEPSGLTHEAFAGFQVDERDKWLDVMRRANLAPR